MRCEAYVGDEEARLRVENKQLHAINVELTELATKAQKDRQWWFNFAMLNLFLFQLFVVLFCMGK